MRAGSIRRNPARHLHSQCSIVLLCVGLSVGADAKGTADSPVDVEIRKQVTIPAIDLDQDEQRQVVVDREPGQYLGHPTTLLLEDGRTILCVYPMGHGAGPIVYKRSLDGGETWSERLPTPQSWQTSREVPTLHRVIGPDGTKRIMMWSGLYPARLAFSEDEGLTWSELEPVGDWGGIVVMGFVEPLETGKGHYLAMFHDDGQFLRGGPNEYKGSPAGTQSDPPRYTLYQTTSTDGGLTWSAPETVYSSTDLYLCEPGCIRSPDGRQLAVLLRENLRVKNSHIIFSNDEGRTWSPPRELPLALTGDRHTAKYAPDGRLFISLRCVSPENRREGRPYEGDWVGWVGTYDDLVDGNEGTYVVRLKDNLKAYDCAYPGVEVLPDGTFVVTTYGHWNPEEEPYILSVRFKLDELDTKLNEGNSDVPHVSILRTGLIYRNPAPHLRSQHAYYPSVIRLEDRAWLASFVLCSAMESMDAQIYLVRSEDDGETWSKPIPLHRKSPTHTETGRITQISDGQTVLLLSESERVDPNIGATNSATLGHVPNRMSLYRSDDGGITWQGPEWIDPPLVGPTFELCSPIVELPDGRWLLPTSTWRGWDGDAPNGMKAVVLISEDKGKTWPQYADVMDRYSEGILHWEQKVTPIDDDRVLAMAWVYDENRRADLLNHYTVANQKALSFVTSMTTGLHGQTPELLHLGKGVVLCAYRRTDEPGLWACLAKIDASGKWQTLHQQCVWRPVLPPPQKEGEGLIEQFRGLKFGAPCLRRINQREVLLTFWCVEDSVADIRWVRLQCDFD
ncbi:MAG: exo-alpha-sialidase [Phycisphaeraceae bacterium]|nr:exo-alpha-sialidase [Phycisphaeraceae bacterium]